MFTEHNRIEARCLVPLRHFEAAQKEPVQKKINVIVIHVLPPSSVKSVPEPQPLPSCMPRPKRKAPIATCAPGPSKTGVCQPDVPVRSAKKNEAPPSIRTRVGSRGDAADGVEVIRTLLLHRLSDDLGQIILISAAFLFSAALP